MDAQAFIGVVQSQACTGAIETIMSALAKVPGKNPLVADADRSKWFNSLQLSDQRMVREVISEAVQQATFNFLSILDGVAPLTDIADVHLELISVSNGVRQVLNDDSAEELHRLFLRSNNDVAMQSHKGLMTYEVGTFSDLKLRLKISDQLHLHRVPTKYSASQTIPGYDPASAPCIALPQFEHRKVESE